MPYVTRALCPLAIQLVLAAGPAAAQSLRLAEDPDVLIRRAQSDSNDATAHYDAALAWWSRRDSARADRALSVALRLDPSFAPAWLARGVLRRFEAASFRRAFLLDPFVDAGILGLDLDWRRVDESLRDVARSGLDSVPARQLWIHHLAAVRAGRLHEALADAEALLRQALARERSGQDAALPLGAGEFRHIIAVLHQRLGNRREAARLFREALEHDVGNYAAHSQLARLHEAAGDTAGALIEWRRAAETDPDDHTLLLDLGMALSRARRWGEAEEALVRAAELGPRDERVTRQLALVRQRPERRP